MTTLPTTSTYRLPRAPGGSGPGQPPPHNVNVGGPAAAAVLTPADIWRVIRGNLWLIIAAVIVAVGIGIGVYAYLLKTDPKYRSLGQLLVNRPYRINPTNNTILDGNEEFVLSIEQRTQQLQLTSETLWFDVLEENQKVRDTKWFKNFQAKAQDGKTTAVQLAKADLDDNLRATPVSDTKVINLTMECGNADDARDIVQAIGDKHIDNQQKRTQDRTSGELQAARAWKATATDNAKKTKDRMNTVMSRASVDIGRSTMKELEMSQLIGEQTKTNSQYNEAQGQLNAVEQAIKEGKDPYQVDAMVQNDPSVQRLQAYLDDVDLRMGSTVRAGTDAMSTKDLEASRNSARAKLERAEASARATARARLLDSSKSEATSRKAELDSLEARITRLRDELSEIGSARAEYTTLKDELDSYKLQEREAEDRVAVLANAFRQQAASVQWTSLPTRPDTLSSPNLKLILPVAVILGLALSLGVAFLRELADTSIRSPRDITRVGPTNVLGLVARESDDPELTGVPLHTVISTAPQSLLAEQLRQVRTRLQHAVSLDTTRTILVTSPGPEDGKTTIACNLAAGLALNGRRILLVDANFHRPSLHKLYNVANDNGFSNVLENVGNLESAVKKTPVTNLEILTTGPRPANQTELLESPLFTDLIERALEEYDHVIFDAGPLLVVSEAVALAPRVDGVITVVRAKKSTRGMLSRVKDTLKQIKAEQLGVVLNGVQTWGGGYYARNIKTYYEYQGEK